MLLSLKVIESAAIPKTAKITFYLLKVRITKSYERLNAEVLIPSNPCPEPH
jgi:hypothetical protein